MHRMGTVALVVTGVAMVVGASTAVGNGDDAAPARHATAILRDASGDSVGRVDFRQRSGGSVVVSARVTELPPGFHGFHVHAAGDCAAPGFTSAMGHFKREGQEHGEHAGDLPVLQVRDDGRAYQMATTSSFRLSSLFDADGSAIVVHANADNYAHIPTDRYDPDPDRTTLDTGDGGARIACGIVRG
jgi:Cu-Zn family superoxide dismutase